jgi:hypothetical protein
MIDDTQTAVAQQKKCKSLMLPNRIYMHKGGRPIAFPLYRDADIE